MKSTQIIIAGGGVPGLVLGCLLAQQGLSVTIVDPKPVPENATPPITGRTVALMDTSLRILEEAGLWPHALKSIAGALNILSIADDGNLQDKITRVDFKARELGLESFGYNIPLPHLHVAAMKAFKALKGTAIIAGKIKAFVADENAITVTLDDGTALKSELLVGADGRGSIVRENSDIAAKTRDYKQIAITGLIEHSKPHSNNSVEFHRPGGPFTLVPMPSNQSSFVWVETAEDAENFTKLRRPDLEKAIQERTRGIVGTIKLIAGPESTPLMRLRAQKIISDRVALIAEAAHVISPIGAQGLNLSLRDSAALRDVIIEAVGLGFSAGDPQFLKRYERDRTGDIHTRVFATDGLNRLVSNTSPALAQLRKFGMAVISEPTLLRQMLVQEAFSPQSDSGRSTRAKVKTSTR